MSRVATTGRVSVAGRFDSTFLPTNISGCQLWLRADLGVTLNGGNVSTWADQSGTGHDLTQATAANQPLFVASGLNGLPTVRFDGSTDYLKASAFTLNQPYVICIVAKQSTYTAVSSHDIWFDGNSLATSIITSSTSATHNFSMYAGTEVNFASKVAEGFTFVWTEWNGASSQGFVHGQRVISGNVGSSNAGGFTLGAGGDAGRSCNIEVAEVCIFNAIPTSASRLLWEKYITERYQI